MTLHKSVLFWERGKESLWYHSLPSYNTLLLPRKRDLYGGSGLAIERNVFSKECCLKVHSHYSQARFSFSLQTPFQKKIRNKNSGY